MIYDTSDGIYEVLEKVAARLLQEHGLSYAPTDVVDAVLRQPEMVDYAQNLQARLDREAQPAEDVTTEAAIDPRHYDFEDRRLREVALHLAVNGPCWANDNGPVGRANDYLTFLKGDANGAS